VSLAHSPSIVLNGLVLAFDVANRKTFANSIINSTSWSLGSGSVTGYAQNGATAENERVTGTDPFGKSAVVWETRPQGNTADDGGWNSSWYNIDNTKLHRFSVWVKRTTSTSGGIFYLGLYGNNGIRRTDNNAVEGNPYWDCRGTSGFEKDVWYLVVGHCYPYNTTYTGQHPESGIYTVAGGPTTVASINACNIGADVKWAGSDVTQAIHRCYHYYCSDSTTRLQLFDPRIDVIDGTEPSISSLLSGFTANRLSSLTNNITGSFVNGPTYSSVNGGSIVFDGTNDYVTTGFTRGTLGNQTTLISWYRYTGTSERTYSPIFGGIESNGSGTEFFIGKNAGNTNIGVQDGNYYDSFVTGSNAFDGNYHQIVYTYDNGTGKIYLDGILRNTGSFTKCNDSEQIAIGVELEGGGYYFIGNIATTQIYNRALTAAEITQNFNALRGRFGI